MNVQIIKGTIKEILEIIRNLYNSDVCAIFLISENMDEDEKLEILEERLKRIQKKYDEENQSLTNPLSRYMELDKNSLKKVLDEIKILKFCFEEVQNSQAKNLPASGRFWDYSYDRRPFKWVIFKKVDKNIPILFEGLTAYSIRTGEEIFADNSTKINEYPSISHLQAVEKGISPPCKMVVFLHLKDPDNENKLIGLLKIENYEDREEEKAKFSEDSKQTEETRQYLPLLAKLVKKTREQYKEYSYENLYGGLKLLDALKSLTLGNTTEANNEIYRQTRHLFFVLKRNEYVGHEEIFERVINYAKDIAGDKILSVTGRKTFKMILEEYKKYEDLMLYGIKGYRDHFMHQFHVFVLGYIILNKIGMSKIVQSVNQSLKYVQDRSDPQVNFTEDNILRMWFLTAFYHDTAYILEKFNIGISGFLTRLFGQQVAFKIGGSQLLLIDDAKNSDKDKTGNYAEHLNNLLKYFDRGKQTNPDLLPYYLNSIIRMNDHAVYSALLLIQYFAGEGNIERLRECYIAALAISFHNSSIYEHLFENGRPGISFESFPFGFLLAFCDTAQIWGREESIGEQRVKEKRSRESHGRETNGTKENMGEQQYVKQKLLGVEFNKNEIICKVLFETSYPVQHPTPELIRAKIIQGKDSIFRSSTFRFTIEFYAGKSSENCKKILTIPFKYNGVK